MKRLFLLVAVGVLTVSSASQTQSQIDKHLAVLRNAFPNSSTPAGVVLTPKARAFLREDPDAADLARFLFEDSNSGELIYFIFGALVAEKDIDCQRCGPHSGFGHEDPFRMEISPEWKAGNVGTDRTLKAVWVRGVDADLSAFRIEHLHGPAVIGAFRDQDVRVGHYAVLYKKKRWPGSVRANNVGVGSCVPHDHTLGTFAVVPELDLKP